MIWHLLGTDSDDGARLLELLEDGDGDERIVGVVDKYVDSELFNLLFTYLFSITVCLLPTVHS